ncbi:hypothetical protein OE88DRAFT_1733531 [Heliocybe sulcata]|uniref:Uncharacterized protein n=1 Tax=Heliocybe sulcata TaxID=5364 RepID=A0A5C3N753_9AGAM|nr:hypothetical protein OE88DRAFT_1733531 [Heliocybe sulcata]
MSGKYVPPAKRGERKWDGSTATYAMSDIQRAIPGERSHTFSRAYLDPSESSETKDAGVSRLLVANLPDKSKNEHEDNLASITRKEFSHTICRIQVSTRSHINPPDELWTRNNIFCLEENRGKPIPLFQASTDRRKMEFKGYYEITNITVYQGGSEVEKFIKERSESGRKKSKDTWEQLFGATWAKVDLRRVDDAALGNPMEEKSAT